MVYCTLSNKKYLLQGIGLVYSLYLHSTSKHTIYYLCLDDYSFDKLKYIQENYDLKVYPIHYLDIEKDYPELVKLKELDFSEYCYSFSSILPMFIFDKYKEQSILYLDSDVYFYNSPEYIFQEIRNRDVGLVRHRHIGREHFAGEYNVNSVFIRNNENGRKVLAWWYNAFITKTPVELSTCGDQKFLEGFELVIGSDNIAVVDNIVGHGAPWNYKLYDFSRFSETPRIIKWRGVEQVFIFNHFSRFTCDFEKDSFSYTNGDFGGDTYYGNIFNIPELHQLYEEYYHILKQLNNQLEII